MTDGWEETRLEFLARQHEVRRRQLDPSLEFEEFPQPAPSQAALVQMFKDLLHQQTTPATAAKRISEWVVSVPDVDPCYDISNAYDHTFALIFSAANQLSSREHLTRLVDLVFELANLPYVYNTKDEPTEFEDGLIVVQPGERISQHDQAGDGMWPGLPGFARGMWHGLTYGPQKYHTVYPITVQQAIYEQEEQEYTNLNTFAALVAKRHPPQGSPLNCCLLNAHGVFAFLEHGPDTPRGLDSHRTIRAAAAWIELAGQEILELGPQFARGESGSDSLWEAEDGGKSVDVKRLRFWQRRLRSIREDEGLTPEKAVKASIDAEAALEKLIAAQDWT